MKSQAPLLARRPCSLGSNDRPALDNPVRSLLRHFSESSSEVRSEDANANAEIDMEGHSYGGGQQGSGMGAGSEWDEQPVWHQQQQFDGAGHSSEDTFVGDDASGSRSRSRSRSRSGSGSGSGVNDDRGHGGGGGGVSHGAVASHFLSQPNQAYGGQTWMDFLREAGSAGSEVDPNPTFHPFNLPRPPSRDAENPLLSRPPRRATATENPLPPLPGQNLPPLQAFPYLQSQPQPQLQPRPFQNQQYRPHPPLRPPVRHAHSASTSNSRFTLPALLPEDQGQQASGRSSSDRKRRLTTTESPMRRHPSGMRTLSSGAGTPAAARNPTGSTSDSVLLHSSSAITPARASETRPPVPLGLGSQSSGVGGGNGIGNGGMSVGGLRRESDLVLPPWQADGEVSHCFVCGSQFTFFYRKHHCRKCGRVVCSACSPHRITIPRQFIVHPPNDIPNIIDLAADDEENNLTSAFGPLRNNPALGGGEEVRVCNPCVPDPNYSPPPPYNSTQTGSPYPSQFSPPAHRPGHAPQHRGGHRSSQSVSENAQVAGHGQATNLTRDPFTDRRMSYHSGTHVADLWPPPAQQQAPHSGHSSYDQSILAHSRPNPHTTTSSPTQPHPGDRYPLGASIFRPTAPQAQPQPMHPPPVPTPRRQIAEEDECPICGTELPPFGPNGDDTARTQHVEECIYLHSSSPPPAPSTSASINQITSQSLPSQRTRGMSNAAGLAAGSAVGGNGEGASRARNRMSMNMSARGMIVYTATEKDAVDDEGEEAECVICFDEFEAGVKMARLVCFCKFHEKCIKQWWEKKGRGACPTHQLHD